jgi:hypothetical protein
MRADAPEAEEPSHPDRGDDGSRGKPRQDQGSACGRSDSRTRAEYAEQMRARGDQWQSSAGDDAQGMSERQGLDHDRDGGSLRPGDGTTWQDRPDRPQDLPSTRPYDQSGGLTRPAPRDQFALENAVPVSEDGSPERFPEPGERWSALVNNGGPSADRFRGNNCLDCSLSFISTYHGHPEVAAARFPDRRPDDTPDHLSGEVGGMDRAEQWLRHPYEHLGSANEGCQAIADKLRDGGHGSTAAIVNTWQYGGSHAWNAVNHNGEIFWVDSQIGKVETRPVHPPSRMDQIWAIVIDREGNRM